MTLEQINALTIDSHFRELVFRLQIDAEVEIAGPGYSGVNFITGVKPTLQEFEAEFLIYKQELLDAENARLAEVARVDDIKARYSALEDNIHVLKAGTSFSNYPNPAIILKEIIENDDQVTLSSLEAKLPALAAQIQEEADILALKKLGAASKKCCDDCLDLVRGFNRGRLKADIDAMKATFAPIYVELQYGSVDEARLLIEAVTNDGVIDILKQRLLNEITSHGF